MWAPQGPSLAPQNIQNLGAQWGLFPARLPRTASSLSPWGLTSWVSSPQELSSDEGGGWEGERVTLVGEETTVGEEEGEEEKEGKLRQRGE